VIGLAFTLARDEAPSAEVRTALVADLTERPQAVPCDCCPNDSDDVQRFEREGSPVILATCRACRAASMRHAKAEVERTEEYSGPIPREFGERSDAIIRAQRDNLLERADAYAGQP
jgi:hypothetical protein